LYPTTAVDIISKARMHANSLESFDVDHINILFLMKVEEDKDAISIL
jgi:hypothetical protein